MTQTVHNRPIGTVTTLPKLSPKFWDELYQNHRNAFIYREMRKFNCSFEEAKAVFQETVIALVEKKMDTRALSRADCLKHYLYKIGDNKFTIRLR